MQAQTWLDQNYPQGGWINYYGEKEQRRWVGEIYINEQLEGELDLSDFKNRQFKVLISHYVDETKFEIKNLTGIKLTNAQEYIDQEYPTEESRTKERKVKKLDEQLTPYGDNYNTERIKNWREANHDLIIIVKKIKETEQMLNNLNKALLNQTLEELTDKALQVFIFESESEIIELQKQLNLAHEKQLTQIEIPIKGNN